MLIIALLMVFVLLVMAGVLLTSPRAGQWCAWCNRNCPGESESCSRRL